MLTLQQHLSGKSHIIWDWNGTLLDDTDICIEVVSTLLHKHQLPPVDRATYRQKFRFPVIEYYRDIGFDLEVHDFATLSDEYIAKYYERVRECSLFHGIKDLILMLKKTGISHSVLSAAHQDHLEDILSHHELRSHFEHVYGLSDCYAHSKIQRGQQLIAQIEKPKYEMILVGDTDHDLEVGKELGIDVLLIADGHQEFERLDAIHDRVIRSRYDQVI